MGRTKEVEPKIGTSGAAKEKQRRRRGRPTLPRALDENMQDIRGEATEDRIIQRSRATSKAAMGKQRQWEGYQSRPEPRMGASRAREEK